MPANLDGSDSKRGDPPEPKTEDRRKSRKQGRTRDTMSKTSLSRNPTPHPRSRSGNRRSLDGRSGGLPKRRVAGRLASPRDREYLRKQKALERERVELALAAAPHTLDLVEVGEISLDVAFSGAAFSSSAFSSGATLNDASPDSIPIDLSPASCPVCAGTQIRCDEVVRGERIRLSECLRCDHLWTASRRRWGGGDVSRAPWTGSVPNG